MSANHGKHEDGYNPSTHARAGSGIPNTLMELRKTKPKVPLDPVKEWERIKAVWNGDVAGWQRYSGFKLPDTHPDYVV